MKKIFLFLLISLNLISFEITDERAYQISLQFLPQKMIDRCKDDTTDCKHLEIERILSFIDSDRESGWVPDGSVRFLSYKIFTYFTFNMPNDPNDYLFLAWDDGVDDGWWRILKTNDNANSFEYVCDTEAFIDLGFGWSFRLIDLTGDNIPELLNEGGSYGMKPNSQGITIWQWKNGCFRNIIDPSEGNEYEVPDLGTNSFLEIDDLDGDGKAEIVIGPSMKMVKATDEFGNENWQDISWVPVNNGEVWHYNGEYFVKWYEFSPYEEHPFYVPSLAAFHPSTIPLSELKNPGEGKIKIFVSDPVGTLTADDFKTDGFTYRDNPVEFKKIWDNQKYPSEDRANFEFVGVPVYQSLRKSQGEWETNPSDPYILSPEENMEYHFVGKYVEIEIERPLVFPFILSEANKTFDVEPEKEKTTVVISLDGKFKNGKIAKISALIDVKNTKNEKK